MSTVARSDAARITTARHRKVHQYGSVLEIVALLLRLAAAGLLGAVGWIHLHL
jgi:hypothetical protein